MKTAKRKSSASHNCGIRFRLILVGLIILTACICNSCDPDDDDTTDGTSGATSMNHSIRKSMHNNDLDFIESATILLG